jgi:hypothetical protein
MMQTNPAAADAIVVVAMENMVVTGDYKGT